MSDRFLLQFKPWPACLPALPGPPTYETNMQQSKLNCPTLKYKQYVSQRELRKRDKGT
jgi:hypothetical protein